MQIQNIYHIIWIILESECLTCNIYKKKVRNSVTCQNQGNSKIVYPGKHYKLISGYIIKKKSISNNNNIIVNTFVNQDKLIKNHSYQIPPKPVNYIDVATSAHWRQWDYQFGVIRCLSRVGQHWLLPPCPAQIPLTSTCCEQLSSVMTYTNEAVANNTSSNNF